MISEQLYKTFQEAKRVRSCSAGSCAHQERKRDTFRRRRIRPDFTGSVRLTLRPGRQKRRALRTAIPIFFPKYSVILQSKMMQWSAITAAMADGTGLARFARTFPDRFFDVGIAEEHALTFAAGLAAGGLKPVVAVYSSFLQRAFDQTIHDVCLQNLPVMIAVDRAGLVGSDGETHQGLFDLSFLNHDPEYDDPVTEKQMGDGGYGAVLCGFPVSGGTALSKRRRLRGIVRHFGLRSSMEKVRSLYEEEDIAVIFVGHMAETGSYRCVTD